MRHRNPEVALRRISWAGALLCLLAGPCAHAVDYQFHGYAAQGLVWSSDNNIFGNSTDVSTDYYEAALNGSVSIWPQLLISAQGAIRDAGATDTGRPRLDFALADYQPFNGEYGSAGIRVGKIKNPMGFYNATRDDIFTRPSVLLPSLYGDDQNLRALTYSSVGAQVYGHILLGRHDLSATVTASTHHSLSDAEKKLLIQLVYAGHNVPFSLSLNDSWNYQVMDSIDEGRWQFAYSYFYGRFLIDAALPTAPPAPVFARIDAGLDVFSVRYNGERVSVTAEYALNPNEDFLAINGTEIPSENSQATADSGYLQGDYRINSHWSVSARADLFFHNRNDRSGTDYAQANPGVSRYSRFAYDYMAGVHWRHDEHWGVWAEYHWIDGSGTVQSLDNLDRSIANRWSVLAMMAAYTF